MNIAIVGGGIVGSTAAFYISQSGNDVVLYDNGVGQATKAAAGIICPWFSKRRNKPWYRLANEGAHFYIQLLADLKRCGIESSAYQRKTTWLLKNKVQALDELIALVQTRKAAAPLIGEINKLTPEKQQQTLPLWHYGQDVIQFDGAAVVNGEQLSQDLQQAAQQNGCQIKIEKAVMEVISDKTIIINGMVFDAVILANGAWLSEILSPHGYHVDVRAQKGQLAVYKTSFDTAAWPLIIPEGEGDIIPHSDGTLFLGATHENEKGFDLNIDADNIDPLLNNLQPYLPGFNLRNYADIKVGSRAYTSDYSPFFGPLHDNGRILVASGLGSSGLTTGPLIGYNLSLMVLGGETTLPIKNYSALNYVKKP